MISFRAHVLIQGEPGTPKREGHRGHKPKDAFQDFEKNTKDAWDDADDDLILMANVRLSRRGVQDTAMQVKDLHPGIVDTITLKVIYHMTGV